MVCIEGSSTIMECMRKGPEDYIKSGSPVDVEKREADCNTQHP
jgi:hypothetical protein